MTSGGGALAAWVGRGGVWEPFGYVRKPGLRVSDAALLPGGDLLMLEHRYSAQTGSVVRFVRVARNAIVPRQRVEGRELALLEPPLTTENFEGVAIRRGDKRETLIYVISDDNFNPLRRTLLFLFAMRPDEPPPAPRASAPDEKTGAQKNPPCRRVLCRVMSCALMRTRPRAFPWRARRGASGGALRPRASRRACR